MPLDALFSDEFVLPHGFNALHEELSSGGHEADGDDDYTEANPRVGLGVFHREVAFPLPVGIRGGWVVFESVILARGVVQEDPRGNITRVAISVGRGASGKFHTHMTRRTTAVPLLKWRK